MSVKLTLIRKYYKDATHGIIFCEASKQLICATLERPNNNNKRDDSSTPENESSCIPEGRYELKFRFSLKFNRNLYEVMNVPNRTGILIHTANTVSQLTGCIAPCREIKTDVKHKGIVYKSWASKSIDAHTSLLNFLRQNQRGQIHLTITS